MVIAWPPRTSRAIGKGVVSSEETKYGANLWCMTTAAERNNAWRLTASALQTRSRCPKRAVEDNDSFAGPAQTGPSWPSAGSRWAVTRRAKDHMRPAKKTCASSPHIQRRPQVVVNVSRGLGIAPHEALFRREVSPTNVHRNGFGPVVGLGLPPGTSAAEP